MKDFFKLEWKDIESAIEGLLNPQQFVNQLADTIEEPTQKMLIKSLFSQLYSSAQKKRFQKDLTGVVIVDHEWNAQSAYSNYFDNSQYLASIIEELEPVRIFAGPSAASYLKIMSKFTPVQSEPFGIHPIVLYMR